MNDDIVSRAQVVEAVGPEGASLYFDSAEVLSADALKNLRKEVEEYVYDLDSVKKLYKNLDVPLAERIGQACLSLLDRAGSMKPAAVAAVVGAVRYFIAPGDAQDDVWSERGLDDDARLINLVIEASGSGVLPVKLE